MRESKLMLHCGGKAASRDDLDLIPVPAKTDTYTPIGHFDLTKRIETISQDMLVGWTLRSESFGLARDGAQLFAILTFINHDPDIGLSIGYRNSLDKSMSIGIVAGGSVMVCDNHNLALHGEIEISRKHTGEMLTDIEDRLLKVLYRAGKDHQKVIERSTELKAQTMGELYGNNIISPRQLTTVKAEWLKPSYEPFAPRNAWSLYNACTQALKTSPPAQVMEDHIKLSRFFDTIIDAEIIEEALEPAAVVPADLAV